jgi:tetratricopeptide (TPR) repeat protein
LWDESRAYPQYFQDAGTVEEYLDGILLWQEGHHEEAIEAMRKAVKAWPKFYDARTSLAIFLADSGKVPEAISMLEKLTKAPIEGKMMRPETITYNLAKIRADQGELDKAENLYRTAISETAERNCKYFRKMVSGVDEAQSCNLAETCEDLSSGGSYRCDLKSCSSYAKPASRLPSAASSAFCHSLAGETFVAAHNNLGDVYLRQAEKAGEEREKWISRALHQFQVALDGAEADSEMWHRVNLNLARAYLARNDREGFVGTLSQGLRRQSAPVLTYISLLEKAGPSSTSTSTARLYLDVAEDAWGQDPPQQVQSQLEALASALDGPERPSEDRLLSARARRLLQPESSLPIEASSPLAEETERLRHALIEDDAGASRAAVVQVQAACPGLLQDASSCPGALHETSRDALFLNGRWYLEQGDKARALEYFTAAAKIDPSWPLSQRYIEQLQAVQ